MIETPSPHHDDRGGAAVRFVVLHYTGMPTGAAALHRLTDPAAKVSAHFLIDEDGTTYRLVDESRRAWHAGRGSWGCVTDVNAASIGIELVNPGHDWGYRAFPEPQIDQLCGLLRGIMDRHGVTPAGVIGHSDCAPSRKRDPGERFPWARLAAAGLADPTPRIAPSDRPSLAQGAQGAAVTALQQGLAVIGYGLAVDGVFGPHTAAVVAAFQRRRRPLCVDGVADADTQALVGALSAA